MSRKNSVQLLLFVYPSSWQGGGDGIGVQVDEIAAKVVQLAESDVDLIDATARLSQTRGCGARDIEIIAANGQRDQPRISIQRRQLIELSEHAYAPSSSAAGGSDPFDRPGIRVLPRLEVVDC